MDLWHQISFEIPELHSMLLFVAYSSFSAEVKAQLQWVLQDHQASLSHAAPLLTKTLRLHSLFHISEVKKFFLSISNKTTH